MRFCHWEKKMEKRRGKKNRMNSHAKKNAVKFKENKEIKLKKYKMSFEKGNKNVET